MISDLGLPGTHWDGEVCDVCGRRNVVGFEVPDALWKAVVGDSSAVCCLTCFDERAELRGIRYSMPGVKFSHVSWSDWDTMAGLGEPPLKRRKDLSVMPNSVEGQELTDM